MPVFTDFERWNQWQAQQVRLQIQLNEEIIKDVVEEFSARVVRRTPKGNPALWKTQRWPKGYVPGNLKKSWKTEHSTRSSVVYNDAVYAAVIEGGLHSKQAPKGMMRITFAELPEIIKKISREKL